MRLEEICACLEAALDLERRPVGVRFLFTGDEYNDCSAAEWSGCGNYCQMVQAVSVRNTLRPDGVCVKASLPQLRCKSSARAFGMIDVPEDYANGSTPLKLGLYADLASCREVYNRMGNCHQRAFGFSVMPLQAFDDVNAPHVVLIISNPYNVMRIVQGYSYSNGGCVNMSMFGNRALCTEATAYPFDKNQINVSVMCSGARFYCRWRRDEMAVGLPYGKLSSTVDGIVRTINAAEPQEDKLRISERSSRSGAAAVHIRPDGIDLRRSYFHTYSGKQNKN